MATLYAFKNYNNYYNRKLKRHDNLTDYPEPDFIETETYCNFNPNDGIETTIIFGRPGFNDYPGDCDYLIYSYDNVNITSRWFIIEQQRKMGNQYQVSLHRDILADNWDKILNSDCFIEKAILPDNNKLIFNKEDMALNQIKKGEHLLKDETGVAWVIGFIPTSYDGGSLSFEGNAIADYTATTKSAFESSLDVYSGVSYRNETDRNIFRIPTCFHQTSHGTDIYTKHYFTYNAITNTWTNETVGTLSSAPEWYTNSSSAFLNLFNKFKNEFDTSYFTDYVNYMTPNTSSIVWSDSKKSLVESLASKVVDITTGADQGYYRIDTSATSDTGSYSGITYATTINYIQSFMSGIGTGAVTSINLERQYSASSYGLTEIAYGTYDISFPGKTGRLHLKDAPYDMFCIPYGNIELRNSQVVGFTNVEMTPSLALTIAQGIAKEIGTSNIIDLQLVPYCPMTGFNIGEGYLDINNSNSDRYTAITKNSDTVGYILWSTAVSGSKNIDYTIDITNIKIENQCDIYRLVSPNYNGQFEFNAAMNNGVTTFNVDFTYIPYQPFIHVNPVFNNDGLYGGNYNDARGLQAGGDYSISYLSDAWKNYQVQNKNFQNIFDREIQNMEVNHKYDMIQSGVGALTGALGTGVTAGLITGNPFVGIAAGALSTVGGAADMGIKQTLYNEALDYKKDMFGYQLDNIKALPYSLAKVSTINQINKIFPFVEYYTCSDEEKDALAYKIAWNSMTVGVISKISNFINNNWSYNGIEDKGYIKAKLIRFEDSNEDFHNVNAIANELNQGVYTK